MVGVTEPITRKPALLSGNLALVFATVATVVCALYSAVGLALSGLGLVLTGLAVALGSRPAADVAGGALLAGTIAAGLVAPPPAVLVAMVGSVLAWDLVTHAIGVGEQLGREAHTARGELAHAGMGLVVSGAASVGGYAIFRLASGGQPATALVFMLLAAIVLISALRL